MDGLPVTIRLLDPPLHEFLPTEDDADRGGRRASCGVTPDVVRARNAALHEFNPMLGHRGCRLAITYPEIYEMQVRAILEAACEVRARASTVQPEIMIPLVGHERELALHARARRCAPPTPCSRASERDASPTPSAP